VSSAFPIHWRVSTTGQRRRRPLGRVGAVLLTIACAGELPGRALIFFATDDPTYNIKAPGCELANSGWQYVGRWGLYVGVPVAADYFLTAKHLGGAVGDAFSYDGQRYTTVAYADDPGSDLRLWRVAGAFPRYAPLNEHRGESGARVVIFGFGSRRGAPVVVGQPNNLTGAVAMAMEMAAPQAASRGAPADLPRQGHSSGIAGAEATGSRAEGSSARPSRTGTSSQTRTGQTKWPRRSDRSTPRTAPTPCPPTWQPPAPEPIAGLKGWLWGLRDGELRWGENVVQAAFDVGGALGGVLRICFDANGGPNEAMIASGDSGGAVFLQTGQVWKLAGVVYGADGPYRLTADSPTFNAALFDRGGLFQASGAPIPDTANDQPSCFFATRVSSRLNWIRGVIGPP